MATRGCVCSGYRVGQRGSNCWCGCPSVSGGPPSCLSPQSLCSFCSNALPSDLTGLLQDSPGATEMNPGEMNVTEGKMRCHLRPLGKELQQLHFMDGHTEAW